MRNVNETTVQSQQLNRRELRYVCECLEMIENELTHELESGTGRLGGALIMAMAARRKVNSLLPE